MPYELPKFARGAPPLPPFEEDPYGRVPRYRELPSHRMPQYEDDDLGKKRIRQSREVILQRADEWSDPWMRSKSPSRHEKRMSRRDRKSYSSHSSYSSSSSSRSVSSSESSGSPSLNHRKRYKRHRSKDNDKHSHSKPPARKNLSPPSPTGKRTEKRGALSPISNAEKRVPEKVTPTAFLPAKRKKVSFF